MVSSHLSRTATRQKFSLQEKLFRHLVRVFIDLDNIDYLNKKTINISAQTIFMHINVNQKIMVISDNMDHWLLSLSKKFQILNFHIVMKLN